MTREQKLRKVILTLTSLEAEAFEFAAGNTIDADDILESLFPSARERLAAKRSMQKLRSAIKCRNNKRIEQ